MRLLVIRVRKMVELLWILCHPPRCIEVNTTAMIQASHEGGRILFSHFHFHYPEPKTTSQYVQIVHWRIMWTHLPLLSGGIFLLLILRVRIRLNKSPQGDPTLLKDFWATELWLFNKAWNGLENIFLSIFDWFELRIYQKFYVHTSAIAQCGGRRAPWA